mmetsp:Transcript_55204/g.101128  ORF Transcript_55204/g.101128 Transcript_55204/m.101128 type:complete len:281 (+) Transcript_55204:2759-3601(+)
MPELSARRSCSLLHSFEDASSSARRIAVSRACEANCACDWAAVERSSVSWRCMRCTSSWDARVLSRDFDCRRSHSFVLISSSAFSTESSRVAACISARACTAAPRSSPNCICRLCTSSRDRLVPSVAFACNRSTSPVRASSSARITASSLEVAANSALACVDALHSCSSRSWILLRPSAADLELSAAVSRSRWHSATLASSSIFAQESSTDREWPSSFARASAERSCSNCVWTVCKSRSRRVCKTTCSCLDRALFVLWSRNCSHSLALASRSASARSRCS